MKKIHLARNRKALCKFDKRDPSRWKKGHYWVSADHKEFAKKATCKSCKKVKTK